MSLWARWMRGLTGALIGVGIGCGSVGVESPGGGGGTGGIINGGEGGKTTGIITATHTTSTTSSGTGGEGGSVGSGPPYPIVFAHGFFGFEEFAGLDFETYFYGVKEHLSTQGEIVLTPAVDPFNDSESRGAELLHHVQNFVAATGAAKVNLIGHSQGGLDARVVANLRPDLVASVITIATPHNGTPVADVAMKVLGDPNAQAIIDALVKLIGGALYDTVGDKTSLTKALDLFSQPGITAFNQNHPDEPSVFYASIAGRSALHGMGNACEADVVVPFIQPWEKELDPLNVLFGATEFLLAGTSNHINDGLVRAQDARRGEFWGCIPADHLDEVGQILGQSPGLGNDWDHLAFYTELVAHIRLLGY